MDSIDFALKRQIDTNQSKNILYTEFERIFDIAPEFLAMSRQLMTDDENVWHPDRVEEHISFAVKALLERLYFINQFVYINGEKITALEKIYWNTRKRILATRQIQETLRDYHYPQLRQWVSGLYPASFIEPLQSSAYVGHVVCREYSAAFQIDCLQMDICSLKQPLLDIGCGKQAELVRYLKSLGIEAYGIDRCLEQATSALQCIDWFDFPFRPGMWGTILSNMAFSNHFLYARQHNSPQLNAYFLLFDTMCRSLKPGGSLCYAPDLPFAEDRLDFDSYRLEKSVIFQNIGRTRITRLSS